MMKTNHPKHNWFVDALLFVSFLIACWLELTGIEMHQWLGMGVGAFAIYHLVAHWAWVKNVASRFFSNTSGQARWFMILDVSLLLGFIAILGSGLIISTWFGLALGNYAAWSTLHVLATISTLVLLIVKIGMHWRWIVNITKRYIVPPAPVKPGMPTLEPVPATNVTSRREFLKLMGVVGAASLLPMVNVLDALIQDQAQAASSNSVVRATSTTITSTSSRAITNSTTSKSTTNSTATNCTVRCSKACSYPGRCRKYVDSNNNRRCDLGECV
jgi:hypothetical protein